ncbi:hypothetical protein BDK61_1477 [Haloarcula quadrata]|uniref:Uncharacterized protein n=1 Tax=Haloarcula quadrata TaxID=182779 RepID=A0A495R4B6_9EURY|nr:hypothetical protein [Haloarcula quadrata]RKS82177.1 hypothetical protein BDK61_1477 [Haloarcula quadrata]
MSLLGRLAYHAGQLAAYVVTIEVEEQDGETHIVHRVKSPREIVTGLIDRVRAGDAR